MSFIFENRMTTRDVNVHCNFSLYPMSNDFVSIILDALEKTDTSHIKVYTDALSTTYSGNLFEVIKTLQLFFINAYRDGVHTTLEGRIAKESMGKESVSLNYQELMTEFNFPVLCKFSLYEFKETNELSRLFEIAQKDSMMFSNQNDIFYLEGSVNKVFSFLNQVYMSANTESNDCILHFTLSVNSPSNQ